MAHSERLEALETRVAALEAGQADDRIRLKNLADYRVRMVKALHHYTYESGAGSLKACLEMLDVYKGLMLKIPPSPLKDALWKAAEALDQYATRQTAIAEYMGKIMSGK